MPIALSLAMTIDGDGTMLALLLNRAMRDDPEAQARYQAIWGKRWIPLTTPDGTVIGSDVKVTEQSLAGTVACRAR